MHIPSSFLVIFQRDALNYFEMEMQLHWLCKTIFKCCSLYKIFDQDSTFRKRYRGVLHISVLPSPLHLAWVTIEPSGRRLLTPLRLFASPNALKTTYICVQTLGFILSSSTLLVHNNKLATSLWSSDPMPLHMQKQNTKGKKKENSYIRGAGCPFDTRMLLPSRTCNSDVNVQLHN